MTQASAHKERFSIRWSDLDANRHVKNTIFSELATHARFRLLESHGFDQTKFESLRFGPVMIREEIRYRRELLLGDRVTVSVLFAGLSNDGSHWAVVQEVERDDGKQAAILSIDGGWIDLGSRKLVAPPGDLLELLEALPRTADFQGLKSLLRKADAQP
jgi:acyl-CoA thioester hydrolase